MMLMQNIIKLVVLVIVVLFLIDNMFITSFDDKRVCNQIPHQVYDVVTSPRQYIDKPLLIEGVVVQTCYISDYSCYLIFDEKKPDNSIWVYTKGIPPKCNTRISIRGELNIVFNINQKDYLRFVGTLCSV